MMVGMRGKGFILGLEKVKIVDEMAATRSYLFHVSNFVHQHFLLIKRKLKGNRMSETQKKKKSWQQKNSHVGLISMVAFIFQFVVMYTYIIQIKCLKLLSQQNWSTAHVGHTAYGLL